MIGKATVFAIAMLAPGFAFAADSGATGTAPAVAAHEKADAKTDSVKSADTTAKANTAVKKVKAVKTVKTTAHKAKAAPDADKAAPARSFPSCHCRAGGNPPAARISVLPVAPVFR